jgi:hypothetical protein
MAWSSFSSTMGFCTTQSPLSISQLPSDFVHALKAEGLSFGEVIFGLFFVSYIKVLRIDF